MTARKVGIGAYVLIVVAVIAVLLAVSSIITVTLMPIWPGEMKLTAFAFCDPGTEARVVTDSWSTGDGTSMNFTLYCLGPRGEAFNAGAGWPFGLLTLAHSLILAALAAAVVVPKVLRKRRARAT